MTAGTLKRDPADPLHDRDLEGSPSNRTNAAPGKPNAAYQRYAAPGLGRDGVTALDDSAVQAGMLGARRELATLDPSSPEYEDRRHNLAVLQWEAAQRGLAQAGDLPASHGRTGPYGIVLFDDPVHCRFVLEQQIAAVGIEGARGFVQRFRSMIGDGPRPEAPV